MSVQDQSGWVDPPDLQVVFLLRRIVEPCQLFTLWHRTVQRTTCGREQLTRGARRAFTEGQTHRTKCGVMVECHPTLELASPLRTRCRKGFGGTGWSARSRRACRAVYFAFLTGGDARVQMISSIKKYVHTVELTCGEFPRFCVKVSRRRLLGVLPRRLPGEGCVTCRLVQSTLGTGQTASHVNPHVIRCSIQMVLIPAALVDT